MNIQVSEKFSVPQHVVDYMRDNLGTIPQDSISLWKLIQMMNWEDVTAEQLTAVIAYLRP